MSFYPSELSTVDGSSGATKSFNFADLPCPPASVVSADAPFYNPVATPGQAYYPKLAPPMDLYGLDPTWKYCVTAVAGFDPPTALPTAFGPSNSNNRPIFPPRNVQEEVTRVARTAHNVRYIPLQTDSP